jgi:hypothetical protein
MTSAIVPGNIDGTFPIAGQDNSSQGFRDNFTAIKNNFTTAASEITDLQANKASTNAATSFTDQIVSRAALKDTAEIVYDHLTVSSGTLTLNHENGNFHVAEVTGNVTLDFTNFPAVGRLGRIILLITVGPSVTAITMPSSVKKATNVTGSDGSSVTVNPGVGRYMWEFMSTSGPTPTTVYMHQLGDYHS